MDLRGALERSGEFSVSGEGGRWTARRKRLVPSRRLFRMLFPCAKVRPTATGISIRPDGWAWFMVALCLGGLAVEIGMDRTRYPRSYPPAFIYGLTAFIVIGLIVEVWRTREAVRRATGRVG